MAPRPAPCYASRASRASMPVAAAGPRSSFQRRVMNDRESRVIEGAKSGVRFARRLNDAPRRVTEAATRVETAVSFAKATLEKQRGAKSSRRAPRHSVNRAKTILLRKHLHPIAADGLVLFGGLPGIEESLRLPRIKDKPETHLKAAERVRRIAEEHEQEFITQRDYSENFLEKFDGAVQDLETALKVDAGWARAQYTRATRDMKSAITAVRQALDALDARMIESYLDDRDTLRQWRWESRVPAKLGRPKKRKTTRKRPEVPILSMNDERPERAP